VRIPDPTSSGRALVTGSAGHLGEALMRTLPDHGYSVRGLDVAPSAFTALVGSIADRAFVRRCMEGIDVVLHTATLHKPHVVTHSRQDFVDTNISGTLNLLEEAAAAGVRAFIFTSTTSVYSRAITEDAGIASWITEEVAPRPKNIYGITKLAAENICELFHRRYDLPCLILRTSRFFPEPDDDAAVRAAYADTNAKVNEFLYRRVELEDVVSAHLRALERAAALRFGRYIVSATTPFSREDATALATDTPAVVRRYVPSYPNVYRRLGWSMLPALDRVYANDVARRELGWHPRYDFGYVLERVAGGGDYRSALTAAIGSKGYHEETFAEGPYPVD
jgi:UDP-glucose 4-epimerase